ncbi:MAG: hypothetical protein K6G47_00225 [Clostridia bacterium]|nr:hypothetical protein [Clostridia bacterium]
METKVKKIIADAFSSVADITAKEASVINEMIDFVQDVDSIAKKVNSMESDADMIVHTTSLQLKELGIIADEESQNYYKVLSLIEECTDVIEDLAIAYNSFNVTSLREDYVPMLVAVEQASHSLTMLASSMKKPSKVGPIQLAIIDLNHSRDEGVRMYSEAMKNLFTYEKDPVEIIRWKEIYSLTRDVFVAYEDVADACEEFILRFEVK